MHLVTGAEMKLERVGEMQGVAGWIAATVERLKARGERRAERRHLRVVETISLGPKKQLVLVSCNGERFLVGTGPDSVGTMMRVRPEQGVMHSVEGAGR